MSLVSIADAFRDDQAAEQYLELALGVGTFLPSCLFPPRKWVQALFLTDAGRLQISSHHLASVLDVSPTIAETVVTHLAEVNDGDYGVLLCRWRMTLPPAFNPG